MRQLRLASKSAGTVKLADTPTRFHVENMPEGTYIVVPEVSSERRRYVPMGFMTPDILCSNLVKIIPNATLYHLGVLIDIWGSHSRRSNKFVFLCEPLIEHNRFIIFYNSVKGSIGQYVFHPDKLREIDLSCLCVKTDHHFFSPPFLRQA